MSIGKPFKTLTLAAAPVGKAKRSAATKKAWLKRKRAVPTPDLPKGATLADYTALKSMVDTMPPDERQALDTGYLEAQRGGYTGNKGDFLIDQLALYQHAEEDDPRLKTFFYGASVDKLKATSAWRLVEERAAQQQAAAPPTPTPIATQPERV